MDSFEMPECKGFEVAVEQVFADVPADIRVSHGFTDGGVLLTISGGGVSGSIHTDRQSLIRFAERVLREFGEGT